MTTHTTKHKTKHVLKKRIRRVPKHKNSGVIRIIILLVLIAATWLLLEDQDKEGRGDFDSAPIVALDKIYMGCKVLWLKQGPGKHCTQSIVDTFFGDKEKDIQIVVANGMEQKFLVKARHQKSSKSYQINSKGIVFLDVNGCLVKIEAARLTKDDFEAFEAKCKK
jgi:hypothetical protein